MVWSLVLFYSPLFSSSLAFFSELIYWRISAFWESSKTGSSGSDLTYFLITLGLNPLTVQTLSQLQQAASMWQYLFSLASQVEMRHVEFMCSFKMRMPVDMSNTCQLWFECQINTSPLHARDPFFMYQALLDEPLNGSIASFLKRGISCRRVRTRSSNSQTSRTMRTT